MIDLSGAFRLKKMIIKNGMALSILKNMVEQIWLWIDAFASAIKNRATDNNSENNYNKSTQVIWFANPGCYATAISVALKAIVATENSRSVLGDCGC